MGELQHRVTRVGRSPVVVLLIVSGLIVALALAMNRTSYDIWGALWVAPLLCGLTVPIANRMARQESDPRVGRVVLAAFWVKMLGAVVRYVMVNGFYGSGDAIRYSNAGKVLAPAFRHGDYTNLGQITGTRFPELLTGQIFALIGPSNLGGYMVYAWLAFVGVILMVRAFRIAVPDGDHRRFRLLVLFYPSLLFWPASIGKDAWMVFSIGVAVYGLARLLTGRTASGLVILGLGLWWATIVRPHIALLLVVASAAAVIVRSVAPAPTVGGSRLHRLRTVAAAMGLVVAVVVLTAQAQHFLKLNDINSESASGVLSGVALRTGEGGSQFTTVSPNNPIGYGVAIVTVLVRPFPFEARSAQVLASSAEGMLLLVVIVASFRRLARLPSAALRSPFVLAALVYLMAFTYAFSSINNFGILARQRVQALPFVFVLLCLPPRPKRSRPGRDVKVTSIAAS
jgi:hypothetical protein